MSWSDKCQKCEYYFSFHSGRAVYLECRNPILLNKNNGDDIYAPDQNRNGKCYYFEKEKTIIEMLISFFKKCSDVPWLC